MALKENHNNGKKLAVINDLSGFGRCSLAVSLPVISALKVQCCPFPTALFSNQTGYDSYYMKDCTNDMIPFMKEWKKLGLEFDGIATGFIETAEQAKHIKKFIKEFKKENTILEVDPVMGDNGKTYQNYSHELKEILKEILCEANIITPNLTEACLLTETCYHEAPWKTAELYRIIEKLSDMGPEKVVITGIPQGDFIANLCLIKGSEPQFTRSHKVGHGRSGTGDLFAAILIADAVNGVDFKESTQKATRFMKKCLVESERMNIPPNDGLCFEKFLTTLK